MERLMRFGLFFSCCNQLLSIFWCINIKGFPTADELAVGPYYKTIKSKHKPYDTFRGKSGHDSQNH